MTDCFQMYLPFDDFVQVRDGDKLALSIANRHYSRQWRGNIESKRSRITTHKRLILVDPLGQWVFAWNQQKKRDDGQFGANCVLFRNESDRLSSEIILLAEREWDQLYGPMRKFTYVHPDKIRSTNPGYCFQCAGWQQTKHISTRGLILLIKEADKSQQSYQGEVRE